MDRAWKTNSVNFVPWLNAMAGRSLGSLWTRASVERKDAMSGHSSTRSSTESPEIAAWSVDRLGRSLQHLIGFLNELHAKKVDLYLHQQGIDTTTPAGRAMFSMLGVFGEFERSMIQERVKAGLKRAKAQGKILGRPRVGADMEAKVIALRGKGNGMRRIARELKIGNCTVQRILATV
jgi:DNA invertase Pin-like site-specific DNA recombinase